MAKITLTDLVSGFLSKAGLNNNFQKVEDDLNNKVLYRDNPGSEPNQMEQFLDMNSNRIVNVGSPVAGTDALRLKDITDTDKTSTAAATSIEDTSGYYDTENVEAALQEIWDDLGDTAANEGASRVATEDSGDFYVATDVEATLQEIGPHIQEVVEDVATLQAGSFETGIERIWLSGYYGQGTPGGGDLYYDSADTTTADNGGTVIVDNDGKRWKRESRPGFIDVTWFGSDPDNATRSEMASAIQAAIDWVGSEGYDHDVDFANLDHEIDTAININNQYVKGLRRGSVEQFTETEHTFTITERIGLFSIVDFSPRHSFFTSLAGDLINVDEAGNLPMMRWTGTRGIAVGGRHVINNETGLPIWQANLKNVWVDSQYSTPFNIYGATTFGAYGVHSTNIQTFAPMFNFPPPTQPGITLEKVTSDFCSQFFVGKINSLHIKSCRMEKLLNPPEEALSDPHYIIEVNASNPRGIFVEGFTVSEDASFTPSSSGSILRASDTSGGIVDVTAGYITSSISGYTKISGENARINYVSGDSELDSSNFDFDYSDTLFESAVGGKAGVTSGNGSDELLWNVPSGGKGIYLITFEWEFSGSMNRKVVMLSYSDDQQLFQTSTLLQGPNRPTDEPLVQVGDFPTTEDPWSVYVSNNDNPYRWTAYPINKGLF